METPCTLNTVHIRGPETWRICVEIIPWWHRHQQETWKIIQCTKLAQPRPLAAHQQPHSIFCIIFAIVGNLSWSSCIVYLVSVALSIGFCSWGLRRRISNTSIVSLDHSSKSKQYVRVLRYLLCERVWWQGRDRVMIITAMWLLCQHWPAGARGRCHLAACHLAILPRCPADCQPNSTVGRWIGCSRGLSPLQLPCPAPRAMFITLIIVKQMFVEKTQDCICSSVPVFMQNTRTLSTDSWQQEQDFICLNEKVDTATTTTVTPHHH